MEKYNTGNEQQCAIHDVSTSCDLEEIPFLLQRTITYTGQKTITITIDVKKIKRQMEYYCYNTGIRNNWC